MLNSPAASKLGEGWGAQQQLILLLDGLDEVTKAKRAACLEAINQFSRHHGATEIVVCCRIRDFEALQPALRFQGAIYIQPLNLDQIDHYLSRAGDKLTGVRTALKMEWIRNYRCKTPTPCGDWRKSRFS
ncbi:MAG: hypothetical protein MJA27_21220 [Pseudanabaenales cyanobacterium]|nr:hypothetical protein [Pseudanabaenales cyanobacterium]